MSKLQEILVETATAIAQGQVMGEFVPANTHTHIKILMLDILAESLKESDGDVSKLAEVFTGKVKAL